MILWLEIDGFGSHGSHVWKKSCSEAARVRFQAVRAGTLVFAYSFAGHRAVGKKAPLLVSTAVKHRKFLIVLTGPPPVSFIT